MCNSHAIGRMQISNDIIKVELSDTHQHDEQVRLPARK